MIEQSRRVFLCECGQTLALERAEGDMEVRHRGIIVRSKSMSVTCPRCRKRHALLARPIDSSV